MRYDQSSRRRENKTPAAPLPSVPDLGHKITMPRKSNRAAAKLVASGDVFWDKRKVASKARRTARLDQAQAELYPPAHKLSRNQRTWLLTHLPGWTWDNNTSSLMAPQNLSGDYMSTLVEVTHLPYIQRAILRIQGLPYEELQQLAQLAPSTITLFHRSAITTAQLRVRKQR